MSRIQRKFEELKKKKEKALVAFITAGDPSIEMSLDILAAAIDGGVDMLELGIPFSDPMADGPVIQRSSSRAINAGANIKVVIDMVKTLRQRCGDTFPIILFSYYNPIFSYGCGRFCEDACTAGADGVLIVDLPYEEKDEFEKYSDKQNFPLIHLVAPTTKGQRLDKICSDAKGFIYMINRVGITGVGGVDYAAVKENAARIKQRTDTAVCMGFGISSPQDAASIAPFAEGVVVGSFFEKIIEDNISCSNLPRIIADNAAAMKAALK